MAKNILHITNGDSLTNYLNELNFEGDIFTWREMLCEGPVVPLIDSEDFFEKRRAFLNETYNIKLSDYTFNADLKILENADDYNEINLWFEYDLFCHINLIAAINLLHQKNIKKPIYLICSGYIDGEKLLKGLSELTTQQLKTHYDNKILLQKDDKDMAIAIWRTYCGTDHNILKPYITKKSNFKYLTNCLKAHSKRFPNAKTGLCTIEENILKLINEKNIKSKNHLLGYCLNYQGYYGFGDIQFRRMIEKLSFLFDESGNVLTLNSEGLKALNGEKNYLNEIDNNIAFGGINRLDFVFSTTENKLIKK
ncbi:DUF1835 domain-containing protein [Winogradskyella litorisediminis]|uniref:DUF1835 domain-containing protein n=1 Tax=Winogradskyella litorisediminis TaxID=1156618 RepID=A0ABW3N2K2_9FLAO